MKTLKTAIDFTKNIFDIPWCSIFLFTLRSLWLARNNFIFNNISACNPSQITSLALGKAAEYWSNTYVPNQNLLIVNENSLTQPPVSPSTAWQPPPSWYKLNCDGSPVNSRTGIDGCLRDASGSWLKGFSQYTGEGDTLKAELWAIMLGLDIISQMPLQSQTIIETDSSTTIELILHILTNHHPLRTIIQNCRYLFSNLEGCKLVKGSMKQNRCADKLAKEGRKFQLPLTIFDEVPDFILLQYHEDKPS